MTKKKTKQTLCVMADYMTQGLWKIADDQRHGYVPLTDDEINKLCLPNWIKIQLNTWMDIYEKCDDYLEIPSNTFNYKDFSESGFAIAQAIAKHLSHYTVIYFDELEMKYVTI